MPSSIEPVAPSLNEPDLTIEQAAIKIDVMTSSAGKIHNSRARSSADDKEEIAFMHSSSYG